MTATEKRAPVQGWVSGIPWALHLLAYEAYSKKWAPQPAMIDLEGRNCRGGFSTGELDDFLGKDWRERAMGLDRDALDAARWRALLAACPHMMGTAGLDHAKDGTISCRDGDGYIHAGIEFWTRASPGYHEADRMERGATILTLIADQIIAQGGHAAEVNL